ncbi:MAG: hypothetical protein MH321_06030, partial [Leptospiraceae bacterium]|nr:hypothetical protein [Leptospiraceae bacterium]
MKLIEKMLKDPLEFNSKDFNRLINSYKSSNDKYDVDNALKDLRECVRRIYNLNEEDLKGISNANTGTIGSLNNKITKQRQDEYFQRIENQKPNKKYIRIYAEGDSWFLFPIFVKDIIDWLEENDNYLIYSDAYAGDWITNILYEGQYIKALTTYTPDVFLISGGGNDLVGNERMAVMVSRHKDPNQAKYKVDSEKLSHIVDQKQRDLILLAQQHITREFYSFIWVMKAQYTMMFKGLYENTD